MWHSIQFLILKRSWFMNIPEYSIHATFCQAITCAVCLHNRTKKKLNEKGIKNKRSKPEFFSFFFHTLTTTSTCCEMTSANLISSLDSQIASNDCVILAKSKMDVSDYLRHEVILRCFISYWLNCHENNGPSRIVWATWYYVDIDDNSVLFAPTIWAFQCLLSYLCSCLHFEDVV